MTAEREDFEADMEAQHLELQALKLNVETYREHSAQWKREAQQANATIAKLQAYMTATTPHNMPVYVFNDIMAIIRGVK